MILSHTVFTIAKTQKSEIKNQVPQYELKHVSSNCSPKTKWSELCYHTHFIYNCLVLCILGQSFLNEVLKEKRLSNIFFFVYWLWITEERKRKIRYECYMLAVLLMCTVVVLCCFMPTHTNIMTSINPPAVASAVCCCPVLRLSQWTEGKWLYALELLVRN